jgi:predicted DCC family thiol-disulfide oxidoreductase YuxK
MDRMGFRLRRNGHVRRRFALADDTRKLTVYYDGSCPLCRAEIGHYRRQSGSEAMDFLDIADATAQLGPDLDRATAMKRFHVRESDGRLYSGAQAFTRIWTRLPAWRWAAQVARVPGGIALLDLLYRGFLPIRPALSRTACRIQRWRQRRSAATG